MKLTWMHEYILIYIVPQLNAKYEQSSSIKIDTAANAAEI